MQIHYNIEELPQFTNSVITIGTFDGIHQGHRKVIGQLIEEAKRVQGESVIITFHPHPRKIVSSSILGIRLINTLQERIELLAETGVDHLVITPFTDAFAHQKPEEYLREFLIEKFHPHTIIIGYDHRFGRGRMGDFHLLETYQERYHYQLKEIPRHVLDHIAISSTKIREAILRGDSEATNHLLGYTFFFEGVVVHGDKIGRQLGFPTANIKVTDEEKIVPGDGIYAVYARVRTGAHKTGTELLKGMMSIGFRPTVDGRKRVIEVNLFDFDAEIYGETVRVCVKQFLRPEEKFENLPDLVAQIARDKVASLQLL